MRYPGTLRRVGPSPSLDGSAPRNVNQGPQMGAVHLPLALLPNHTFMDLSWVFGDGTKVWRDAGGTCAVLLAYMSSERGRIYQEQPVSTDGAVYGHDVLSNVTVVTRSWYLICLASVSKMQSYGYYHALLSWEWRERDHLEYPGVDWSIILK
jgi:hypothetical protein